MGIDCNAMLTEKLAVPSLVGNAVAGQTRCATGWPASIPVSAQHDRKHSSPLVARRRIDVPAEAQSISNPAEAPGFLSGGNRQSVDLLHHPGQLTARANSRPVRSERLISSIRTSARRRGVLASPVSAGSGLPVGQIDPPTDAVGNIRTPHRRPARPAHP